MIEAVIRITLLWPELQGCTAGYTLNSGVYGLEASSSSRIERLNSRLPSPHQELALAALLLHLLTSFQEPRYRTRKVRVRHRES